MIARGLIVLALALGPLAARGEGSGQAAGRPVLRGPERPPRASSVHAISPLPRASLPPDMASELLASPAQPLAASTPASFGGAECRNTCALDLYLCRADRDEVDCNPVWTRCVVACPEGSSSLP